MNIFDGGNWQLQIQGKLIHSRISITYISDLILSRSESLSIFRLIYVIQELSTQQVFLASTQNKILRQILKVLCFVVGFGKCSIGKNLAFVYRNFVSFDLAFPCPKIN